MKSDGRGASEIEGEASAWIARRDAGLTAADEVEFERWMANPQNAAAFKRHERTWRLFDRPNRAGQGHVLAGEFRERFRRQRRRRVIAVASTLTCLVFSGIAWRMMLSPKVLPVAAKSIVVAPERRTLPDGSIVELNRGAEISVDFSGELRRVSLLKGEVHYDVAKDPKRPFVVKVGGVEVRAVGTAFSVEFGREAVAILVTEGAVVVESSLPAATKSGIPSKEASHDLGMVDAGNRLVVDLRPGTLAVAKLNPVSATETAERLAWRAPRLEFFGAPLAEAVAQMNRYNKVQFVVEDPGVATLEVSGYFRADNHVTFLELIEPGLGLRSEQRGDKIFLQKAR